MMENPFKPRSDINEKMSSDPRLNALARQLVFATNSLTSTAVSQAFERTRQQPGDNAPEQKLDSAQEAFLGIAAHEAAEQAFAAFNAEFTKHRHPERLTREEVREMFTRSRYAKNLQQLEQEAINHFSQALKKNPRFSVAPSEGTRFDAVDIRGYLIDLKNRVAERIEDPVERKTNLERLDSELAELIKSLPEEDWGKKLELQEIYLLRRLIHRADTGHVTHVSHGTLRQDLRPDMGSIDMRLTAAGDIYDYQIKTFKTNVSRESKAKQYDVVAKKKHQTEQSGTLFAILQTDRVQVAYDRALRQNTSDKQTVGDKFQALQPLTDNLTAHERARLLELVGLTEETLAKEQADLERGQALINEGIRQQQEKEALEKAKFNEVLAQREQREAEERARELAAIQAQIAHEEAQRQASEEKRKAMAEEKERHLKAKSDLNAREKERLESIKRERQEQEAAAKAAAEKKAKTKETKAQSEAKAKWVKERLVDLMKPDALIQAGFLDPKERNAIPSILAAKKIAESLYTKKYILEHYPFEDSSEMKNPAAE